MTRFALVAAVMLAVMAGQACAKSPHYGSVGIQMGFYKYPPPGAAPVGYNTGYAIAGCAPSTGYAVAGYAPMAGYAVPSAGYAPVAGYAPSAGYAPVAGYAPSAGYAPMAGYAPSAGYAPAMAPYGGCSGGAGPSYGYGAGYGSGYGAPAAGMFALPGMGALGVLEAIRIARDISKELDGGAGAGFKDELQKLRDDVSKLRADVSTVSKAEIQSLRDEVKAMRDDLGRLKVPSELDKTLKDMKADQQNTTVVLQKIIAALKEKGITVP